MHDIYIYMHIYKCFSLPDHWTDECCKLITYTAMSDVKSLNSPAGKDAIWLLERVLRKQGEHEVLTHMCENTSACVLTHRFCRDLSPSRIPAGSDTMLFPWTYLWSCISQCVRASTYSGISHHTYRCCREARPLKMSPGSHEIWLLKSVLWKTPVRLYIPFTLKKMRL